MDEHSMLNTNLTASKPYYFDSITWCLQKNKPISVAKAVFRLCNDPFVYAILALEALVSTNFAYFMEMFEKATHRKWNVFEFSVAGFACHSGWSCIYQPRNNAARIFAIFIYLGTFSFSIILITFVLQCFTTPLFDPQVESIEQMIKNDYKLIGNAFAFNKISERNQVKII